MFTLVRKWEGLLRGGRKATFLSGEHVLRGLHSEVKGHLVLHDGDVWAQI